MFCSWFFGNGRKRHGGRVGFSDFQINQKTLTWCVWLIKFHWCQSKLNFYFIRNRCFWVRVCVCVCVSLSVCECVAFYCKHIKMLLLCVCFLRLLSDWLNWWTPPKRSTVFVKSPSRRCMGMYGQVCVSVCFGKNVHHFDQLLAGREREREENTEEMIRCCEHTIRVRDRSFSQNKVFWLIYKISNLFLRLKRRRKQKKDLEIGIEFPN